MAIWRFVNLDFPEAQPLADLTGFDQDLASTKSFCKLLIEELQKQPPNWHLVEALSTAALVRYSRAFATGIRNAGRIRLKSALKELPEELRDQHDSYIDLRNRHIAHSVSSFEENRVSAYLIPEERGPRGVASISVQHQRLVSLGVNDAKRLENLCERIQSHVANLIEIEKAKVLEIARSMPIDDLYTQVDAPGQLTSM